MLAEAPPPRNSTPITTRPSWRKIGTHVTKRLNANPLVQQVEHPDAQLYVYQGFLSTADCKGLIDKIDAEAVPSTLYKGTEQEGFRTSYSCHLNRWDPFVVKRRGADERCARHRQWLCRNDAGPALPGRPGIQIAS